MPELKKGVHRRTITNTADGFADPGESALILHQQRIAAPLHLHVAHLLVLAQFRDKAEQGH